MVVSSRRVPTRLTNQPTTVSTEKEMVAGTPPRPMPVGQVEVTQLDVEGADQDEQPVADDHHEQNAENRGGKRKARRR
ncbi:hypothetical protein [Actinophytocola sp.]|uniref:hypothetical protein n=1 Tax=Actinophytocola sp. TaxID=1872138 RepID=UPI002D611E06|nr:hypothetical protein [Actinophytocola sp.]HYQ67272.1 hypothetical protein [Actinophytocola sp.]